MKDSSIKQKLLSSNGVGGNNETWWYLCLNCKNGSIYVQKEWSNMKYDLSISSGTEIFTLEQLADKDQELFAKTLISLMEIFD